MTWNKSTLALVILGSVMVTELALIGVLAGLGVEIPDQAWSLVYATLGTLGGIAGAQFLNGKNA